MIHIDADTIRRLQVGKYHSSVLRAEQFDQSIAA
jgi:hypothetical protein